MIYVGIYIFIFMLILLDKFEYFFFVYSIYLFYQVYGRQFLVYIIYSQVFCYIVFL